MKIRITGKSLPKAQTAGQYPNRNSVSINGTTYFEGDPGYEQAKQEAAQMKQQNSAFSNLVNSRINPGINIVLQGTRPFACSGVLHVEV